MGRNPANTWNGDKDAEDEIIITAWRDFMASGYAKRNSETWGLGSQIFETEMEIEKEEEEEGDDDNKKELEMKMDGDWMLLGQLQEKEAKYIQENEENQEYWQNLK